MAAQAGHGRTIDVRKWPAGLTMADDLTPAGLTVQVDMNSLAAFNLGDTVNVPVDMRFPQAVTAAGAGGGP